MPLKIKVDKHEDKQPTVELGLKQLDDYVYVTATVNGKENFIGRFAQTPNGLRYEVPVWGSPPFDRFDKEVFQHQVAAHSLKVGTYSI